MMEQIHDEEGQRLRHIVAGMLSTIDFTPDQMSPMHMLPMADNVIRHIRLLTSEDVMTAEADPYPVTRAEAPR